MRRLRCLPGRLARWIESNGTYYVIKCISDYDEEATAARKKIIFEERKRKAFKEIYDSFREGINLTYSGIPGISWSLGPDGTRQVRISLKFTESIQENNGRKAGQRMEERQRGQSRRNLKSRRRQRGPAAGWFVLLLVAALAAAVSGAFSAPSEGAGRREGQNEGFLGGCGDRVLPR